MPDPDDLIASYDFALPRELIAQVPPPQRGDSRLLVAGTNGSVEHRRFSELPSLLRAGDLLILNDTRVLAARLAAQRESGGSVRMLALEPDGAGAWWCMVKPSSRIKEGESLTLRRRGSEEIGPRVRVGAARGGARRVSAEGEELSSLFASWGEMPLPPYIDRRQGPREEDRDRYQTVFAAHDGAVAAPTAGLHFTPALLSALSAAGVQQERVTLHVGAGTFAPVREEQLSAIAMHAEQYRVPGPTAQALLEASARGRRIVAVGTTAARTIESWHRSGRATDGAWRSTSLFLHPGDPPRLPFSLLTNFHLPRSTLLVLVASLVGRARALSLYRDAVDRGYRFFSYGDASLFL